MLIIVTVTHMMAKESFLILCFSTTKFRIMKEEFQIPLGGNKPKILKQMVITLYSMEHILDIELKVVVTHILTVDRCEI